MQQNKISGILLHRFLRIILSFPLKTRHSFKMPGAHMRFLQDKSIMTLDVGKAVNRVKYTVSIWVAQAPQILFRFSPNPEENAEQKCRSLLEQRYCVAGSTCGIPNSYQCTSYR
ncbi:hypothetical protein AVEN_258990-1 [Araneus ventricosus]|uniref:Uncharacterized protein n=1 Tax=Araneus ventricosus TaxID=182803 RepID=A0A4Y2R482_ARAVE|nr:hypothetical protein AVEN_95103-1 [Araneus ventricosus]GBN70492.1 hypothetical protein AVEN_128529-1 [Araneus ventricosus]GBN70515.1 hypothetical protein AVEN_190042-1 [Araneus ventricosus]GBN70525.1 hypothetical protein AVEN_258990-1 [Araneus ventricosus]